VRDTLQLVVGAEYELRALGGRLENIAFAKLYHLGVDAETPRAGGVFDEVTTSRTLPGVGDSVRLRVRGALFVKASYEWATRLPSSDELFGDGVLVNPSPALQPERSHNVNLAAQLAHEGRTGAWTGELAGFARLADQLIVLLGTEQALKYDNVYAARIAGVEGSAGWTAPDGWAQLVANATVQDLRNASSEGTFGRFDGDRIPNRPWLFASLEGSVRARDLLRANDELMLFGVSRYVHGFYRGWERQGLGAYKQVIPRQLAHGVGLTYAARGPTALAITVEVQNLTDARVFDSFGVQKPGRALSLKLSGEL
jgi:hypothetical protein